MDNKNLFIEGYLRRISEKFNVGQDIAFEIFSIATITERPFQEVYDEVLIKGGRDGGIDGALLIEQGGYYTLMVFQCKSYYSGLNFNNILREMRNEEVG